MTDAEHNAAIPRPGPMDDRPDCPVCGQGYDYWHPVSEGAVQAPDGAICYNDGALYIHPGGLA